MIRLGLLAFGLATIVPARAEAPREQVLGALPTLETMAQQVIDRGEVPGLAIAVVYQDEVIYLGGFGVREAGRPERVDADTVFQLASCSKPIASTVVAGLVGDGRLTWDSRISDLDPGFQLTEAYPSQQVTVADLFAHRSGLPGDAGNELEAIGFARPEILRRLRLVPPSSSFRAGYSYSNFGLTEGAVAAARAAGLAWEDAAEQRLYRPLGMSATSSRHADFLTRSNRAALHVRVDGVWRALVARDPDPQAPAGGVSSSARDLARWMRLELGGGTFEGKRIIAADAIARTHMPVMSLGPNRVSGAPEFYALGWTVSYAPQGVRWGHAGAFSQGALTVVRLAPGEQLGIMVLSNAFPNGVPDGLADSFLDLALENRFTRNWLGEWSAVYEKTFGPMFAAAGFGTRPRTDSPPLGASAYAGHYANAYVGGATITERDGGLMLSLGPDGAATYKLTHFDRDIFTYTPSPEMPDVKEGASFQIGPDGRATQVTLDSVNGVGLGVLPRAE